MIAALDAGARWAVAGTAGPAPSLAIARAKQASLDLREWLPERRPLAQGKGVGSPEMVSVATSAAVSARAAFDWAIANFEAALEG